MKTTNTAFLIISALLFAFFLSCSTNRPSITGTWSSTSISNPDRLFSKTLPDRRPGIVTFTLLPEGTFSWVNKNEKNIIKGKYSLSGSKLILVTEKEKPVQIKVEIKQTALTLHTDDGFTFTFRRSEN